MISIAAFVDVLKKAKWLFEEGRARIDQVYPSPRKPLLVRGTVVGEHGTYVVILQFSAGGRPTTLEWLSEFENISFPRKWNCGCKWHQYAFWRSPAYKHLEAQPCSHSLALFMQYLKDKEHIEETQDRERPPGQERPLGPWQRVKRRLFGMEENSMFEVENMDDITLFQEVAQEHLKYQKDMRARNVEHLCNYSNDDIINEEDAVKAIQRLFW